MRYVIIVLFISFSVSAQPSGSGNTLDFNGINQYVSLSSSFGTLSFPLTVTTWYKPGSSQSGPVRFLVSHDQAGAYRGIMFQYINGTINVQCGNGTSRSPSGRWGFVANYNFINGRWYHITVSITSATSAQVYVNGLAVSTALGNGTGVKNLVSDNSLGRIGANTSGNNISYINGQLDELTVWSKALSQAEIRAMMCHKLTGNEPNLMAYYRFDTGTGNAISNLVAGGPDGTLVNSPLWVASSAPVGDWSNHNLYNNTNHAIGVSNSGDSIFIQPANTGQAGTHVYVINSLPASTAGITTPPGINYYFGVFNVDYSKNYDVTVQAIGATATFPNGSLKLAKRPHNASTTWTLTNATNTPDISLPGQTPIGQFIIANACPTVDLIPDDSTACDSLGIDLTGYINYNWSNGSTSSINAFFTSGQVWVTAEDPVSGCVVSDTMDVTIINSASMPSTSLDTVICGAGSLTHDISVNGAVRYEWFDLNSNPVRSFNKDGSYWYEVFFPGGCSVKDTLTVKFAIVSTDPIAEEEFYTCGGDTAFIQLRSNTYMDVQWSNGATSWKTYYLHAGVEWVITQNLDGCWQTDTFEIIEQQPLDESRIFNDTSFCAGQSLVLSVPTGYTATWPNGQSGDYVVSATKDIRVEISDGCTESVEFFKVTEYSCSCEVQFPNAFTPDGDGLNDYFGPATKCEFLEFRLQVYNRWGQEVFYSNDETVLFDGRWMNSDLPIGVYVYKFTYRTPYKKGTERGHITLMR